MQYIDPMTGRRVTKSTGVPFGERKRDRDAAEKAAGAWQAELREGRHKPRERATWEEFRTRYLDEVASPPACAEGTTKKVLTVFALVKKIVNPARVRDLNADRLSHFTNELRKGGRAESTIDAYLAHLQAALRWGAAIGMLHEAPKVARPKRGKAGIGMKGRPISGEEFERMLDKVAVGLAAAGNSQAHAASAVKRRESRQRTFGEKALSEYRAKQRDLIADAAPSWRHYLRGLWLSGLRLEESLELHWDRDDRLHVDMTGEFPMLRIPRGQDKANREATLPLTPDFAEFLECTPPAERVGRVFKLQAIRGSGERLTRDRVSRVISAIGRAAGVKVNTSPAGKVKYASAHDLRRSFGTRWSSRLMPAALQKLMRHQSINTTMRFYVMQDAFTLSEELWAAHRKAKAENEAGTPIG